MLEFVKKYKDPIEIISIILAIIFGAYQVYDISRNIRFTSKLESYKLVESLVNDRYIVIAKHREILTFGTNEEIREIDKELSVNMANLMDDIETCINVGACDSEVVKRYICSSSKLTNILSHISGMMITYDAIVSKIKINKIELPKSTKVRQLLDNMYFYKKTHDFLTKILPKDATAKVQNISIQCLPYQNNNLSKKDKAVLRKNIEKQIESQKNMSEKIAEILRLLAKESK